VSLYTNVALSEVYDKVKEKYFKTAYRRAAILLSLNSTNYFKLKLKLKLKNKQILFYSSKFPYMFTLNNTFSYN
jgi:hypothetical protein